MSQSLSKNFQIRIYCLPIPGRIRSYVVRKDGWFTIVLNEALSPDARMKAYHHELDHIERGDFDSEEDTGLIEIRAHERERRSDD